MSDYIKRIIWSDTGSITLRAKSGRMVAYLNGPAADAFTNIIKAAIDAAERASHAVQIEGTNEGGVLGGAGQGNEAEGAGVGVRDAGHQEPAEQTEGAPI